MRDNTPVQGRWRGACAEHLLQYLTQGLIRNVDVAVGKGKSLNEMLEDLKKQRRLVSIEHAKEPIPETADFFPKLWEKTLALAK